jgi:hypothetical protein
MPTALAFFLHDPQREMQLRCRSIFFHPPAAARSLSSIGPSFIFESQRSFLHLLPLDPYLTADGGRLRAKKSSSAGQINM